MTQDSMGLPVRDRPERKLTRARRLLWGFGLLWALSLVVALYPLVTYWRAGPATPAELDDLLQGGLQSQELPLPTAALQPGRLQSLGEFWQALGGKPKSALNYTVTIAVQPFDVLEVSLVLENVYRRPGQG